MHRKVCVVVVMLILGLLFWKGPLGRLWVHTDVRLVTVEEFRRALESPSSRAYFENMGKRDLMVRTVDGRGHGEYATHQDVKDVYLESFVSLSSSDGRIVTLSALAERADRLCRDHTVPALAALPGISWRFAILGGGVGDAAFPHTHADVICVPTTFFRDRGTHKTRIRTLIHEKLHVLQRLRPRLCHQTLLDMGYVRVGPRGHMPDARSNPDLDAFIYRREGRCPTVMRLTGDTLSQTQGVCVQRQSISTTSDDETPDQYEHPFEKMAYTLSELIVSRSEG